MGANPAENHPISFKWILKAAEKGAKVVTVDPRFTKSSAMSDIFTFLRSGTDIAFLGGMIKYILDNNLYFEEYVKEYSNASYLVNPEFKLPGDNEGVFSGLLAEKTDEGYINGVYDKTTWSFQKNPDGSVKKDPTLTDPNCVFQLLKKHYSRYDLDMVNTITGTPKDKLLEVYKAYSETGKKDKSGTILYAMGWTQHTTGVQNVRTMAIIQTLLGNMGMAGGGVNALRGESNVQGSTDAALLFHLLPGYLRAARASQNTLEAYLKSNTPVSKDPMSANWWQNYPKYIASLLRALYSHDLSLEKAYSYLPKLDDGTDYSWITLFDEMFKGTISGYFAWGQNPACSSSNVNKLRQGLGKLKWLVNVNLFHNETGSFWHGPGMNPKEIDTEVFMLPCAASLEKEGSVTNSGRWMQWRYKATDPPGEARPDREIITELIYRLKEKYEKEGGAFAEPIKRLTWEYGPKAADGKITHVDPHYVAKEINGYFVKDVEIGGTLYRKGTLVPAFGLLQADGSTSSGNWLYCNAYTEDGNRAARRGKSDPTGLGLYPEWAWCWPVNRRIIYNRASVDLKGNPWTPEKPVVQWDGTGWKGDVPDGPWPPMADTEKGKYPFIMVPEGMARIFGPGLADGPFPEHYEAHECPIASNPMSPQFVNPVVKRWDIHGDPKFDIRATCDPRYPIVCTTYRTVEHWQTGVMTRWQSWLLELQPCMFVEMSKELADLKGFKNGDEVIVRSARGEVGAVVIVTSRFKPFTIIGQTIHQVGIPWHYGWRWPYPEKRELRSANLLTANIGDPNVMIPESKAFMVDVVRKGGAR